MFADLLLSCARHVMQIVAGLATVALVVRVLGPESLGAWVVLGTTGFLVGLSDLGLSIAVQRTAARQDVAATRQVVRLAVLVVTIVCPFLCACAYAFFLHLPAASEALRADVALAAIPVLVAGLAGSLAAPLRSFLLMRGGFTPLAWTRAASAAVQIALTAAVLLATRSLLGPALGLLAGAVLELLLLAVASRNADPHLDLRPGWPVDPAQARDAFRQGAAALALNIGVAAAIRADALILTSYTSLGTVGAYQVASRAVDQIYVFAKQTSAWLLHRLGDPNHRPGALRLGTAVLGSLVSSGVIALAFDGAALLEAWVGALAHDPVTALVVGLLGTAALIAAAVEMASATLAVSGATPWDVTIPVILGHALNVTVSLVGVSYGGVWAVAGGTVCGNVLIALLVWGKVRALVHWPLREVLWTLAPVGAAGLVSLAVGWGLAPLASRGPLASALVCSLVTLLGTGMALLIWWRRHVLLVAAAPAPPEGASAYVPSP
ncbi:lipopolysaccharide biosynthesis protein [Pyxidicoccus xibeiensis]|uniref:lipopolysaccharide biosynthesis protein n=1 Tax=Pyxidicoccus xibeiensis TaxID=2906759 RepID=UPI0020A80427|nr:oligosaccharide flippase family protein [Pyxidicoccus xibeiensis]MCP3137418.1 oligosaccharide flippase family protein [Pyxidicoccus xibeiensis]